LAVLVDKDTRVIVQGITGGQGTFHSNAMLEYGKEQKYTVFLSMIVY
jgi:succinyl-CoA synthetase alpha subunit